ncbi:MAG: hypothetical protein AAF799_25970 [Myxococcota bacterium]
MPTFFVSGHLDLTDAEFEAHYVPSITEALADSDARFVVGDARGADAKAQAYLSTRAAERVTVFHMFTAPRNNHGAFPTRGGFESDAERDRALTAASDRDIAWVRPGRERSGTAKNIARRSKAGASPP